MKWMTSLKRLRGGILGFLEVLIQLHPKLDLVSQFFVREDPGVQYGVPLDPGSLEGLP